MKEVKLRNQVLCKILSKGECKCVYISIAQYYYYYYYYYAILFLVSTKQELLEQIEELTADKTELSQEVRQTVYV